MEKIQAPGFRALAISYRPLAKPPKVAVALESGAISADRFAVSETLPVEVF